MVKNVIFFVHGVGCHGEDWVHAPGGPVDSLKSAAKQYSCFNDVDLEQLADIVGIRYDHIFDQYLTQWANLAKTLKPVAGANQITEKVTELMSTVDDDRNLYAKYGGDVLLYYAFDLIARRVRLHVNTIISKKITEVLNSVEGSEENPQFGIVGHSLGTTIVHDCVESLASNSWLKPADLDSSDLKLGSAEFSHLQSLLAKSKNPFAPEAFVWDSVFMISNTSCLLHRTENDPYHSLVQPGKAVRNFINIDHTLDPLSKVKPFRLPDAWDQSSALSIEVDHVHAFDVHGYSHYLKHPKVHGMIFQLLFPQFTSECVDEVQQLAGTFPKYAGQFDLVATRDAYINQAKSRIETYKNATLPKYRELIEVFNKYIGKNA